MNALEEKIEPTFARKNAKSIVAKRPKKLFKVVVNNYRQQAKEIPDKKNEEIDETSMDQQQGLPPQPKEYIKYPTYDWF